MTLPERWLAAKEAEKKAQEERRNIEDQLASLFGIGEDHEGTFKADQDGYEVKIVGRFNRKVDSDKLQELAKENGLDTYLTTLFKWDCELKLGAWKATDKSITDKLAGAITTKPGRPSFEISAKGAQE